MRQLRDNLSKYLAQVEQGAEVLVTDHARPVARLLPVSRSGDRLEALVRSGQAQRALQPAKLPRRLRNYPVISDLVAEQRR